MMNFTPFPELRTERLLLRQLLPGDEQDLFRLRSDSRVNEYINRANYASPDEARDFIRMTDERLAAGISVIWAISPHEEPGLIGTVCLWNFDMGRCSAELGYEMHPDFQGKGLMREAIRMVIEYGFGKLPVRTIEAYIKAGNEKSIRLSEKSGFVHRSNHTDIKDNKSFTMLIYSLEKSYE